MCASRRASGTTRAALRAPTLLAFRYASDALKAPLPPPPDFHTTLAGFAPQVPAGDRSGERAVQFMVDMACQSCVAAVNKSLEGVEGTAPAVLAHCTC